MNNSDLEKSLSEISLKPASTDYVAGAEAILKKQQSLQSTSPWWNKALAASLLLSLAVNYMQYQNNTSQTVGDVVANNSEVKQQSQPGGYTIVQTGGSPDGYRQSVTVILENKS